METVGILCLPDPLPGVDGLSRLDAHGCWRAFVLLHEDEQHGRVGQDLNGHDRCTLVRPRQEDPAAKASRPAHDVGQRKHGGPTYRPTPTLANEECVQWHLARRSVVASGEYANMKEGIGSGCSMPVVFRYQGYRFFFFANEGDPREPVHIHVRKGEKVAKFWVVPDVVLAHSYRMTSSELNRLEAVVLQQRELIEEKWHDCFDE